MKRIPTQHLCYSSYDDELVLVISSKMDYNFYSVRCLYQPSKTITMHISYLTDLGSLYALRIPFRSYGSTAECLYHHPELLI